MVSYGISRMEKTVVGGIRILKKFNFSRRKTIVLISFLNIVISLSIGILLQKYHIPSLLLNRIQHYFSKDSFSTNQYAKQVDQHIIETLGRPANIYKATDRYIYRTGKEKKLRENSYRYYWHYQEVVEYLVSEEQKARSNRRNKEFWKINTTNYDQYNKRIEENRDYLKETIGLENLESNGKLISNKFINQIDGLSINKMQIESRIKSISVPIYSITPKDRKVKGVAIAIHGHSSAPQKVVGLEPRDYTRVFGKKLAESGYAVYAPYVMNLSHLNTNIHALGMLYSMNTKYSIDIQKLLSVVDFIKCHSEYSQIPLIVYGVSYGGRLSLILGAIDDRVDIVVSSGSMKPNRQFLEAHYSLGNNIYWANQVIFNHPFHVFFRYSDFAKMIFPKPLIIEIGAFDLGDFPYAIIEEWEAMLKFYRSFDMEHRIKLAWFKGFHEVAPLLTIPMLDSFIIDY